MLHTAAKTRLNGRLKTAPTSPLLQVRIFVQHINFSEKNSTLGSAPKNELLKIVGAEFLPTPTGCPSTQLQSTEG